MWLVCSWYHCFCADFCFLFSSGVSSFNQFVHDFSMDSDNSSLEYSSEDDDSEIYSDGLEYPPTPGSQSSRTSEAGITKFSRHQKDWIRFILLSILFPLKLLVWIPVNLFRLVYYGVSKAMSFTTNKRPPHLRAHKRVLSLKDHIIHRATDRRRGVVEVVQHFFILISIVFFFFR